jgi:hypothetical protein
MNTDLICIHPCYRWPKSSSQFHIVLNDLAALLMLACFMVHIYEGTAAQPGTSNTTAEAFNWNRLTNT